MIGGYLKLLRPFNLIIAGASFFVSFVLAGKFPPLKDFLLSFGVVLFFAGGGYVINDFADIETDRVAHPSRPIPRGEADRNRSLLFGLTLFALGAIFAFSLKPLPRLIALFVFVLLLLYDFYLKDLPLIGNIAVALSASVLFLFGGALVGRLGALIYPAVFAFLYHLGRELVKDVEDVAGDRESGRFTLPLLWGEDRTLKLAGVIYLFLVLLTPIPYLAGVYNLRYFLIVFLGVDLPLLFVIWRFFTEFPDRNLKKVDLFLKVDMIVALFALYEGGLV
ncbi:MAG: geranylgeranylglycerol-phosphate geranylgeranyltransferase [Candidatus Hydrothermae bacterium]|nr:geranylgeranylglycerol-phosphate geranylgeranyltransferase [Candidatus Hydrothermae bacterium]